MIAKQWMVAQSEIKQLSKDSIIDFPTTILANNNQTIAYLSAEHKRVYTKIDNLNDYTIKAFLAIEDSNFYDHYGISFKAIFRAMIANLRAKKIVQGGSTITQQTARAFFLSKDKHYKRKFKEIIYALVLESKFSKKEILELYLNQIYFGKGAYGIKAAAKIFFNKSPKDLSIKQSAYLAGLIKAPSMLSNNLNKARIRQRYVLYRMFKEKYLSKKQYTKSKTSDLNIKRNYKLINNIAPYYVDALKYELAYYLDKSTAKNGLKVYSAFDHDLQKKLDQSIHSKFNFLASNFKSKNSFYKKAQAAGIVYNSFSSEIVAVTGGINYLTSQYNRALFTSRPMNQTIIPLLKLVLYKKKFLDNFDNYNNNDHYFANSTAKMTKDHAKSNFQENTNNSSNNYKNGLIPMDYFNINLNLPQPSSYYTQKDNFHLQLANEVKKYGYLSLYNLFKLFDTYTKRQDFGLLLGNELITPIGLAYLYGSILSGKKKPKKPSLVRKIKYFQSKKHNHEVIIKNSNYDNYHNFHNYAYKKSYPTTNFDCSYVIKSTNKADDYWFVEIKSPYVVVIWIGSERGRIKLPKLNLKNRKKFKTAHQVLSKKICLNKKRHVLYSQN